MIILCEWATAAAGPTDSDARYPGRAAHRGARAVGAEAARRAPAAGGLGGTEVDGPLSALIGHRRTAG